MPDLIPIADATWKLLETPSTATLTTVLSKHGLWNTFMTGVHPLGTHHTGTPTRMVGQAFTLRYIPAREDLDHTGVFDNLTDAQRLAVERIGPRDVLVIDARGEARAGTMGNILATRMKVRGCVGFVSDGCYRDTASILAVGLPTYGKGMHAATNKTIHHPADFQLPIGCGGVAVYPGDILVGDTDGVVVIPRGLAAKVAEDAAAMEDRESFFLFKIQNGAGLLGTYPPNEQTLAEYQRWRQSRGAQQ